MKQAVQFGLRMYRQFLSPMLPHACRFVPTCSEYAIEAVERHGVLQGTLLAAGRLLRCHPFARVGYDPVPPAEGRLGNEQWPERGAEAPLFNLNGN